jgi:hypothetical protein
MPCTDYTTDIGPPPPTALAPVVVVVVVVVGEHKTDPGVSQKEWSAYKGGIPKAKVTRKGSLSASWPAFILY